MAEPHAIITQLVEELHDEATCVAARRRLLEYEPRPIEVLLDLLPGQANRTQVEIARILGHFRDKRALPALAALVNDEALPDPRVRWAALEALRRLESIEAIDLIEEHRFSTDLQLRQRAQRAFRELKHLLQVQLEQEEEREQKSHSQPISDLQRTELPRSFDLSQLSPGRVKDLVEEILAATQVIRRSDLICGVSKRFGRDYLIRVRKWTNRYVYRQAGIGHFRIINDLVELI